MKGIFLCLLMLFGNQAVACADCPDRLPWGASLAQLRLFGWVALHGSPRVVRVPAYVSPAFECEWTFNAKAQASALTCLSPKDSDATGKLTAARFAQQVKLLDRAFGADPAGLFETIDAHRPAKRYFDRLLSKEEEALKIYHSPKQRVVAALSVEPISATAGQLKLLLVPPFK